MATEPVQVKQTAPATSGMPDLFRSFRSEMDRLFDRFGFPAFPRLRFESEFAMPTPAVDVTEDETAYKIAAELPGMSEKDIEVALSGDTLTVKGEKKQETEKKEKNYYLSERSYGSFQRSFTLPDGVDREKVAAEFAKGVLTITLPKTPQAQQQQKKIEVKASA